MHNLLRVVFRDNIFEDIDPFSNICMSEPLLNIDFQCPADELFAWNWHVSNHLIYRFI
jgi:hypothetical protein